MKIAERTYNMHLSEYEAAKVQYDLGMITNLELTDKINNLYKSQISYAQAKLNYRMAIEKYKYDITIGIS
jgi:outer membrane protein TolC